MWYYRDIEHAGLAKFRRVRGNDEYVVQRKADEQLREWDTQWQRQQEIERSREKRLTLAYDRNQKKTLAVRQTEESQAELNELRQILAQTTSLERASWTSLYDRGEFKEASPQKPDYESYPAEPKLTDQQFLPKRSFLSIVLPYVRNRRLKRAQELWQAAQADWDAGIQQIEVRNNALFADHKKQMEGWLARKGAFQSAQEEGNQRIDRLRDRHLNKDPDAIVEFTDLILSRSEYPSCFPKRFEIGFDGQTGVMVVDYELPDVDRLPKIGGVKYIQARDVFENVQLRQKELDELYEAAIYQTCLRTVIEIFASDFIDAIESVAFNGYVDFIDRANGKPARACIVSLQTTKRAIEEIDFREVNPKSCFRALKGVGSSKLSGMAAVVPILKMSRVDQRFIAARDVIDTLDQAVNIAAIPWEDFEHLVRDVFEKEFSSSGGEVKITRASRDHGVDAVAFDPDPIRGGKIVIQAKRYTNPVGVSAVRDLYGTLINEGASRGILVTTSVYGPDSYEFAKGKPITLLDGGNLLHLLEKHGHPARIDLREAKATLAAQDRP